MSEKGKMKRSVNLTIRQIERLRSKPNLSEYVRKLIDDDLAHDALQGMAKLDEEEDLVYKEMLTLNAKLSHLECATAEEIRDEDLQAVKDELEENRKKEDDAHTRRLQAYDKLTAEERARYDAEHEEKGVM